MVRIAVIGAGPAGLVTLKHILAAERQLGTGPVEVKLFEFDTGVGGTFRARTYEDGELVSSRQLTTFSDFRREDGPDFLSVKYYLKYLDDYCTHFHLWPHMNFSCQVTRVENGKSGGHTLTYLSEGAGHEWDCDAVAVCAGLHVDPNTPHLEGVDKVPLVMHSSQFKRREQFGVGTNVLVLGSGETGADVSLLAVTSPTNRVVLCHRNGFHLAPKTNPNPRLILSRSRSTTARPQVPIDVSRASLFDTAYTHPWLRSSSILWTYYDYYVRWILWTSWGTTHGSDQWIGEKPKGWTTAQIFFNKSGNKIAPYINVNWKPKRPQGLLQRLRSLVVHTPTTDTKGRYIDVAPWPERIDDDGIVHFRDNGRPEYQYMKAQPPIKPDVIVFCTGYKHDFPFLPPSSASSRTDVRDIWHRDNPSIGFIGFVRPNLGAIPPLAELQAQLWVLNLLAPVRVAGPLLPEDEPHYRLVAPEGARVNYGVDHESYAYQLALDMGTAPSLTEVCRAGFEASEHGAWWKLPLTWALGANFNTKFTLVGPWRWDGAVEAMTGELWDTVARREVFFGHVTLSVLPIFIFGPMSLLFWLVRGIANAQSPLPPRLFILLSPPRTVARTVSLSVDALLHPVHRGKTPFVHRRLVVADY
ncbi:Uu.00g094690.m01.CDS01 [Anthostomella pinea]|uniref:Uu.00g094690.m01.CDS01 n=1 Tax=Anthostomella pinea TaxID=933095 RepID=A0AAI8YKT8_9PEZI|nr:Uu.00g094690.m01.CDS01 [Anthostomella pinea]